MEQWLQDAAWTGGPASKERKEVSSGVQQPPRAATEATRPRALPSRYPLECRGALTQ